VGAIPFYEQALRIREQLCRAHPDNLDYRSSRDGTRHRLEEAKKQPRELEPGQ
jgi:hypothetical protein